MSTPAAAALATPAPYPAQTRRATGHIGGIPTDVTVLSLADKLLITISQDGRLSQWVHVPLDTGSEFAAGFEEYDEEDGAQAENEMLPLTALTPTMLLGGADGKREAVGQLVAVQIASLVKKRNKDETRLAVFGLGLKAKELERETFVELLLLVGRCL